MEQASDKRSKMSFLNIYVDNITEAEALRRTEKYIEARIGAMISFVNVDVIVKAEEDQFLRKVLKKSELTLVDGQPLIWISNLYRRKIKEKISGSDYVPRLCALAEKKNYRVFILGGAKGIADMAAKKLLKRFPELHITGTCSPPLGFEKDEGELIKIRNEISEAGVDILIACLGCPKQEKFIFENRELYDAGISVCAGATVDFLAGNIKRCPAWMSRAGLEWFFRFLMEPKRLFKRYFVDDIKIIALMCRYWPRKSRV